MKPYYTLILFSFFTLCSCSGQNDFSKFHSKKSYEFEKLPKSKWQSEKSLQILKEIHTSYQKLGIADQEKYKRKIGYTYMTLSLAYSIQNNKDSALLYFSNGAAAGFNDLFYIEMNPGFNSIRETEAFKSLFTKLKKSASDKEDY